MNKQVFKVGVVVKLKPNESQIPELQGKKLVIDKIDVTPTSTFLGFEGQWPHDEDHANWNLAKFMVENSTVAMSSSSITSTSQQTASASPLSTLGQTPKFKKGDIIEFVKHVNQWSESAEDNLFIGYSYTVSDVDDTHSSLIWVKLVGKRKWQVATAFVFVSAAQGQALGQTEPSCECQANHYKPLGVKHFSWCTNYVKEDRQNA